MAGQAPGCHLDLSTEMRASRHERACQSTAKSFRLPEQELFPRLHQHRFGRWDESRTLLHESTRIAILFHEHPEVCGNYNFGRYEFCKHRGFFCIEVPEGAIDARKQNMRLHGDCRLELLRPICRVASVVNANAVKIDHHSQGIGCELAMVCINCVYGDIAEG